MEHFLSQFDGFCAANLGKHYLDGSRSKKKYAQIVSVARSLCGIEYPSHLYSWPRFEHRRASFERKTILKFYYQKKYKWKIFQTTSVNLQQIGFVSYPAAERMIHIVLKSIFVMMFWVSLRQMVQEKQMSKLSISQIQPEAHILASKYGKLCLKFLVKVWMWIVVMTLFAYGIIDEKEMDAFRIIYMALFLMFVVAFQVNLTLNVNGRKNSSPSFFSFP